MTGQEEHILFEKIKKGDEKAFERLFRTYYSHLCLFAENYVQNQAEAEEIVQDIFVKIWEKRDEIEIKSSLKNYLIRSTKNQCLNFIKHNKIKEKHAKTMLSEKESASTGRDNFIEIDLMEKIEESINSLPKKRQEVFRLSREEGLKYREIAEKLGVSIKTVETHMGLAIKTLREQLKNYSTFLTLFYTFIKK